MNENAGFVAAVGAISAIISSAMTWAVGARNARTEAERQRSERVDQIIDKYAALVEPLEEMLTSTREELGEARSMLRDQDEYLLILERDHVRLVREFEAYTETIVRERRVIVEEKQTHTRHVNR